MTFCIIVLFKYFDVPFLGHLFYQVPSSQLKQLSAFNAWFEQILDVALSRRICCSRACNVNTNPRLPSDHPQFVRQDVLELYALIFSLLQSNHNAVRQMRWDTKWLRITDYNISTKFTWWC